MTSIEERIRQARALEVSIGAWKFQARRPTDMEAGELYRENISKGELARRYVTGWTGMRLCDLVGGDDETPAPFDADVWSEWVADHPEVYGPLGEAIMSAYLAHAEQQQAARKN